LDFDSDKKTIKEPILSKYNNGDLRCLADQFRLWCFELLPKKEFEVVDASEKN